MSFFQNPITPPDPYDRYRVDPVEGDRKEKGQNRQGGGEGPPPEKWGLIAYFLQLLHKMVTIIFEKPLRKGQTVTTALRGLKTSLEVLKQEDRSQDIAFLHSLSECWLSLLEESSSLQQNPATSSSFKTLLKKIEHYPENQRHTFGYYLSEFAGQKWIPFPYMELIQKIYTEHQKNASDSPLSEWTALLDDLLLKVE